MAARPSSHAMRWRRLPRVEISLLGDTSSVWTRVYIARVSPKMGETRAHFTGFDLRYSIEKFEYSVLVL